MEFLLARAAALEDALWRHWRSAISPRLSVRERGRAQCEASKAPRADDMTRPSRQCRGLSPATSLSFSLLSGATTAMFHVRRRDARLTAARRPSAPLLDHHPTPVVAVHAQHRTNHPARHRSHDSAQTGSAAASHSSARVARASRDAKQSRSLTPPVATTTTVDPTRSATPALLNRATRILWSEAHSRADVVNLRRPA